MTANRAKSQRIFEEDCEVDRILCLPRNVIDCIMEHMPVRDAARTCVLSSRWRNVWADHPSLILDEDFWEDLRQSRLTNKVRAIYAGANIVNDILLHHSGYIRVFHIDVSVVKNIPDIKINTWLSSVCRRGVKDLCFKKSDCGELYKVPSSVFSNSELTDLSLCHCIIKAKYTIGCFTHIQNLTLEDVTLDSMVLTTPLLTCLSLMNCRGVRDFNISAPRLESLCLRENDYFNLKPFLTCKGINEAFLSSDKKECHKGCERINLPELLNAWPRISELLMDGFCFKYLATGNIPDTLQLNLSKFWLIEIALDADMIAWILCILKNSPLLHAFEIHFCTTYLEEGYEPSLMDYRFEQLRTINMKYFTASKIEAWFAKMLLQCAPALRKLLVEEYAELDPEEQVKILKKLLVHQQVYPKVQIIYGPNLCLEL